MNADPLGQELSDQDRLLLVFGYLGPLALVSLVASRREFVKWHAKQGVAVSVTLAVFYLVLRSFRSLLATVAPQFVAELFWFAALLTLIGFAVAMILCIVRALEGERFKLPLLGELADWL